MILRFDNSAYFDLSSILHRPYNNATELQTKVATPRVNNRPYIFRSWVKKWKDMTLPECFIGKITTLTSILVGIFNA